MATSKARILLIGTSAVLIIGTIIAVSNLGNEDPLNKHQSNSINIPKGIDSTPGGKTSAKYKKLQEKDNLNRATKAKKQGKSSIPTIVGSVKKDAFSKNNDDFLAALGNDGTGATQKAPQRQQRNPNSHLAALLKQQEAFAKEDSLRRKAQRVQASSARSARLSAVQQKKIAAIATAMGNQAKSVLDTWDNFTAQEFVAGDLEDDKKDAKNNNGNSSNNNPTDPNAGETAIKAGDIIFAVLDTHVNTDEPGPIMATIVQGKFKDAKLLGSIKFGANSKKVVLNFNKLSIPELDNSISINAVAIDPSTARTAFATDVDNHYLQRYGMLFASAFLEGYSKAVTESGSKTTTTTAGVTTTEKQSLSGKEQFLAGFGSIGKKVGAQAKKQFNIPPTVTVDAGTGLGLLFLEDIVIASKV